MALEVHTVHPMDSHPAALGDVANDFVTWNGIAALGNPNQEARSPFDDDTALMANLQTVLVFLLDLATLDQLVGHSLGLGPLSFPAFFFRQAIKDGCGRNFAKSNRRKEGFICLVTGPLQDFVHVLAIKILISHITIFLEQVLHQLPTLGHREFLVLIFEKLPNFIAGLVGLDQIDPVSARPKGIGTGDDFHLIPSFELGGQGHHPAIDLGTCCLFPHLGMDFIGKINGHRILGQLPHRTIWGEDIDPLGENVILNRIDKGLGIARIHLQFDEIVDPLELFLAGSRISAPLVGPVGRNPVFSDLVHFLGPNLKFDWALWSVNRGMNGLVTIGLGIGNIVLETTWHRSPEFMNIAQHGIDIAWRIHDAADGNQIIELIKTLFLIVHLAVDGIDMLGPSIDLTDQIALCRIVTNLVHYLLDQVFPLLALLSHQVGNLVKLDLIQIAKGHIFQFPLDGGNPQTVGQGSIDFHSFPGNPLLLVLAQVLESPHIVKPVGQFNQDDPHVLGHGNQHFPVVFSQLLLVGLVLHLTQLGDPVNNHPNVLTKLSLQLIQSDVRILDHIMQKATGHCHRIQFETRQNTRHLNRVNDIGLT